MEAEKVVEPTSYFRPFPEPEDVFAANIQTYCQHFLPLATVSLSRLRDNLPGQIHFVLPTERFICEPGEYTLDQHSYLCRHNWIGFHLDSRDRYTLDTSFDYFVTELRLLRDLKCNADDLSDGLAYYNATHQAYRQNKSRFAASQCLYSYFGNPVEFGYLGGNQGWPNCAHDGDFPHREECLHDANGDVAEHNFIPVAKDGSDFEFVGWLHAFNYAHEIPCNILLFYNAPNRLALQGFDWS